MPAIGVSLARVGRRADGVGGIGDCSSALEASRFAPLLQLKYIIALSLGVHFNFTDGSTWSSSRLSERLCPRRETAR